MRFLANSLQCSQINAANVERFKTMTHELYTCKHILSAQCMHAICWLTIAINRKNGIENARILNTFNRRSSKARASRWLLMPPTQPNKSYSLSQQRQYVSHANIKWNWFQWSQTRCGFVRMQCSERMGQLINKLIGTLQWERHNVS